jgi:RND family efflux transporter MFP subunit
MIRNTPGYLLCLSIATIFLLACSQDGNEAKVERRDLVVSVYGAVTIEAQQQYQAFATVTGIVSGIFVEEGDTVDEGQLILTIENTNPSLNAENAALALQLARENYSGSSSALKNLDLQIQLARQKVQEDSINYVRQQNLWDQNIGSKLEFENRKFAYQSSCNNLNLLQVQKQQLENELSTALQQAENNYQISLQTEKDFELRSRIKGRVYALNKEIGELVNLQESLAVIGAADDFVLELEVDQKDIADIRLGQEVIIELDAYEDRIFNASVRKIYPLMDGRSQTFRVEATFNELPPRLFPGLTGEGNIVVAKKEQVLTIPIEYLTANDEVMNAESEMVKVEVGSRNMEYAEIISGLEEGQTIKKEQD